MLTTESKLLLTLIFLLLLAFLPQLSSAQNEETRNLEYFNSVDFEGHGSIYLKKGKANSITLQVSKRSDLENIKTEIRNNKLFIGYERGNAHSSFDILPKISVYLTYTDLEDMELAGKIKVQTSEAIEGSVFNLKTEGYTTGNIEVNVSNFDLDAEGYARLKISGIANTQHIRLEGLGKIRAEELVSKEADLQIDGSSYISINVSEALYANVQGQARLEFAGEPRIKKIDKEEQAFVGTF